MCAPRVRMSDGGTVLLGLFRCASLEYVQEGVPCFVEIVASYGEGSDDDTAEEKCDDSGDDFLRGGETVSVQGEKTEPVLSNPEESECHENSDGEHQIVRVGDNSVGE